MGSSSHPDADLAPTPGFIARFQARLAGRPALPFAEFMDLALYDRDLGYYRRDRPRVGTAAGTDFFTATSCGPLFGELVAAACVSLLGDHDPEGFTFIEVGAETVGGALTGVPHPFREVRTVRIGEPLALSGPCIVFSNELFDAQPFDRWVRRSNGWCPVAVALKGDGLVEVDGDPVPRPDLPDAPVGYRIDAPRRAAELAQQLARQPWGGLFLAFDYGKTWAEIAHHTPAGTARAYFRHSQSNDLLARPGEQDLTCHVCWDWLSETLAAEGFSSLRLEAQEAFLVRHAARRLQDIVATDTGFSPRKQAILQLLHPGNLGRRFQVLHGWRDWKNHLASTPTRSLLQTL